MPSCSARRHFFVCAASTARSWSRRRTSRGGSRRRPPGCSPPPPRRCGGPSSPPSSTSIRRASEEALARRGFAPSFSARRPLPLGHHGGMKGRRPEEIIGEWGIRDVTPPSAAERDRLEGEHELNPLAGADLPRRVPAFGAQAHTYLAALVGPPIYMRRARMIDEETARHQARLAE